MNEILAVIPARGGSKGIPQKNIRMVAGKPLLAYSIEHAQQTSSITRTVVSTDDPEIANVARQYGAEVSWRPGSISGDTATSESALLHVLDHLRDTDGYEPDLVVFLQATSPIRQPDDIQNALMVLQGEHADALFSACPVHGFVWRREGDSLTSLTYDYCNRQRRQDAPEDLIENGSIYIFKPWVLREYNNRLGGKIAVYRMHVLDSFQVDDPGDLRIQERLLALRRTWPSSVELSAIRLLVLDFDGVLTDNRVLVDQDGREGVLCHRGDGWGIARLKESGIAVMVISTERNPVVAARCRKLNIPYVQDSDDKLSALQEVARQQQLDPDQIAYVGNDVNDLACMHWVACPIAVSDAVPEVHIAARLVTTKPGGWGAVYEVAGWILETLHTSTK